MHSIPVGDADAIEAHCNSMVEMGGTYHTDCEPIWTLEGTSDLLFACNYPGHADLGMEGKIKLQ